MLSAALDDARETRTETTILFLAANPVEIALLQLGEECRAIEDKIRAARFREKLRFRSRWAARPDDLLQALHEDDPAVLHFSGHGAGAQGLCFLAEDGGVFCVNSDGLGQVIRAAGDSIRLVVLNACYTKVQAEALVAHVPCVLGMPSAIGDKSAIVYAAELYRALAFGKSVASAHQCGLAALALHSIAGNMRDIDTAEDVLRTAPPELLVRAGVDATHVHIVQGALSTSAVPASSGESRIHLEIDIDADFETLDASTLSKLMSEICRLSGGRPVRILCVTKGSIRLHLSFEPDAARTLMSLRDSGRLNRIGGFRVSNVVDLGQVEISPQALDHADTAQTSDPVIEIEDVSTTAGSKRGTDSPDLAPALVSVSALFEGDAGAVNDGSRSRSRALPEIAGSGIGNQRASAYPARSLRIRPSWTRTASVACSVALRTRQSLRSAVAVSGAGAAVRCSTRRCSRLRSSDAGEVVTGAAALARWSSVWSATAPSVVSSWSWTVLIDGAARCSTDSVSWSPWRRR